ncbi:hypothetical protein ACWEGQ_24270 [Streptomyces seoulensis]
MARSEPSSQVRKPHTPSSDSEGSHPRRGDPVAERQRSMSPARCGRISMTTAVETARVPDMRSPPVLPTPWKGW